MVKEVYIKPSMDFIFIESGDVIRTSPADPGRDDEIIDED